MPNDQIDQIDQSPVGRYGRYAGLAAAGLVAGVLIAGTVSASAQTSPTAPAPPASSPASPAPKGSDSSTSVREGESLLTGTNAEKARAAALKAVPGGTIVRLETDSGPAEYEAHMRKADGTPVTVLMDANFAVTSIEEGRGGRHGGRGGDCDEKDAATNSPSASASTTSA